MFTQRVDHASGRRHRSGVLIAHFNIVNQTTGRGSQAQQDKGLAERLFAPEDDQEEEVASVWQSPAIDCDRDENNTEPVKEERSREERQRNGSPKREVGLRSQETDRSQTSGRREPKDERCNLSPEI
jgi:hypothetical protein